MTTVQQEPSRRSRRRRPSWLLPAALAVGAVVVAAVVLALTGVLSSPAPEPSPVLLPTPTPTVAPAERDRTTPFQQALPDEVLEFAVASQAEDFGLIDAGAVEAYRLEYTDGERVLVLRTGQWPTPEDAVVGAEVLEAFPEPADATDVSAADASPTDLSLIHI